MPLRSLLVPLLLVAGCRLEPTTDAPASDSLAAVAPPVAAGDTARVTPERAARARPRRQPALAVAPSGWAVPVVGVAPGDLVDTFEQARADTSAQARSEGRTHDAIDILAPRGTPVVAATGGTVARLFTSEKGGLTVYLVADDAAADGRAVVAYYAHLDAYAPGLRDGQRIQRGEVLGTVGDSGNAVPGNTHLHFAVWLAESAADFWDGEALNPYPLLTGR